jgi:hypothetical protein
MKFMALPPRCFPCTSATSAPLLIWRWNREEWFNHGMLKVPSENAKSEGTRRTRIVEHSNEVVGHGHYTWLTAPGRVSKGVLETGDEFM